MVMHTIDLHTPGATLLPRVPMTLINVKVKYTPGKCFTGPVHNRECGAMHLSWGHPVMPKAEIAYGSRLQGVSVTKFSKGAQISKKSGKMCVY
jgi:hypothetical protein